MVTERQREERYTDKKIHCESNTGTDSHMSAHQRCKWRTVCANQTARINKKGFNSLGRLSDGHMRERRGWEEKKERIATGNPAGNGTGLRKIWRMWEDREWGKKNKTRSTNTQWQFNQDLPIVTNGGGQVWKTSGGEQIKRDKNFPANGERKRWASTPSRTSLLAFFYIFNKAIVQIQITHPHMRNCSERVWNQWTWVQDESKGKESNKDIKKLSWDTSCFGLEEEKNGFSSWTAAGSREFADMCLPARCEPTASSQSRFTQNQKHTDTHTRFVTVQKCHWNQMPEKAPRGRPFAPLTQQLLHKWIRTNGCTDRKHMEVYWWTESLQQMKETDSSNNCHRSHLPLLFSH